MEIKAKNTPNNMAKSAYITVETSLIMPMILAGIIFTVYLGFYLYNVCVIREVSYIAALRASQQKEITTSQIKEFADQQLQQLLEERLLAMKITEKEVKVSLGKIKVLVKAEFQMPVFTSVFEKLKIWTFQCEEEAVRIDPVNMIRGVRRIYGN